MTNTETTLKLPFSKSAQKSIQLAVVEARCLRHDYIGTEHLLLGLINPGNLLTEEVRDHTSWNRLLGLVGLSIRKPEANRAIQALITIGLDLNELKTSIVEVVQPSSGPRIIEGQLPLTLRAKHTLEVASQEASALHFKEIQTEHILLALAKDEEGVAAQVLSMYNIDHKDIWEELEKIRALS